LTSEQIQVLTEVFGDAFLRELSLEEKEKEKHKRKE
jgi:hypothetical protein